MSTTNDGLESYDGLESSENLSLMDLGWDPFFAEFAPEFLERGFSVARITTSSRGYYSIRDEEGEVLAQAAGRLIHSAPCKTDLPAVGDWVAAAKSGGESPAVIHHILPRKTVLIRQAAGGRFQAQVIASNVDTVFVTMALDHNFNLRRLERYLVFVRESGAVPAVILTKTDLCSDDDVECKTAQVRELADEVKALTVSSITGEGYSELKGMLRSGSTFCFVGSSGVGKSTLINLLYGEEVARTAAVREFDSKGRHTTTKKQMFFLRDVGILIDTPGMRGLGLWDSGGAIEEIFDDIEELASRCKYRDCAHVNEPGCAVLEAIADGSLDLGRYGSYLKIMEEAERLRFVQSASGPERKRRQKMLSKDIKAFHKYRGKK